MAMYIVEAECISCGDCVPVCPTSSIYEDKIVFKITKETCTECKKLDMEKGCRDECKHGNLT